MRFSTWASLFRLAFLLLNLFPVKLSNNHKMNAYEKQHSYPDSDGQLIMHTFSFQHLRLLQELQQHQHN
ncbi:hypothetical protein CK934_02735 [Chitinophaga sp. MD30]|nr:hypothetical protein CK934_02735 [Chitinophaga sp. MD30]